MDIKSLILKELSKKSEIRVADIRGQTGFSRAYINRFFQALVREGKLVRLGKANQARYAKATRTNILRSKNGSLHFKRAFKNIGLLEDKVLVQIKLETGIFSGLADNISSILDYAFTEMLNNAIEHSRSKTITAEMRRDKQAIRFFINDCGIGIFKNIMKKKRLKSELEAIQDLLKGKQTTAPKAHTGEGIFFTSKAADIFVIKGSNKKVIFDNKISDIFIRDISPVSGTRVEFNISLNSGRGLANIFEEYSGGEFEFSKTKVLVALYKIDTDFISRSQARRIMSGLDRFKIIILDFKKVETVGQSFADEVFRVWKSNHPGIKIINQHVNENIEFMINRVLTADEVKRLYNLGRAAKRGVEI